jgi:rhodanese-related sulfurtransferase
MEELGLFQLENLARTPTRFAFYDLRARRGDEPAALKALLQKATAATEETVVAQLSKDAVEKDSPVVLICEDGKTSAQVARRLTTAGFANVYIVAGGVTALLSEL